MNNYLKEIKALLILSLFVGLFFGFAYLFKFLTESKFGLIIFFLYFLISVVLLVISISIKNKIILKIIEIFTFPFWIIYILMIYILPIGTLLMHLLIYFILTIVIPLLFFNTLLKFNLISLSKEVIVYIEITISVFTSVLLNYQIRRFIYLISPARIYSSEKLKPYEFDKLTNYLLSENNIRFIIYSTYVIFLAVVNFFKFQDMSLFGNNNYDSAVLQSFITFIAFDRALTILKQLEFKPSDLLMKIVTSINNKINSNP